MTDTYFDIFGQKSNAIFQQNNYSANTFHVLTDFPISSWRIKLSVEKCKSIAIFAKKKCCKLNHDSLKQFA